MSDLFRREAREARSLRVLGDVVITDSGTNVTLVSAIGLVSLVLVAWATLAQYTRTEQVQGTVVTSRPVVKVMPSRAGVIERLHVSEGTLVQRGQALASVLVDTSTVVGRGVARDSLATIDNRIELRRSQLELEEKSNEDNHGRLQDALILNTREANDLKRQRTLQEEIVTSAGAILEQLTPMAEQGYLSRLDYETRRQAHLQEQQRLQQIRVQLVKNAADRRDLEFQLHTLATDHARRMADLNADLQTLRQAQASMSAEVSYVIVAPVSGRVTALQAASGRSVEPRLPVMIIVPKQSVFEAEVYAPSRAIGFVQPGQAVRLLYDAFPYKRFGSYGGRVVSVSQSIVAPADLDVASKVDEPVYRVRIALDRQDIDAAGHRASLQPGMTLTANIVLDRRSFFDWLLEPLNAVRRRT